MDPEDDRGVASEGELDSDGASVFERAMRGVEPLRKGSERQTGRSRKTLPGTSPGKGARALSIERDGESMEGLSRGVSRRELDRLRRGDIPVDEQLDLHGLKERAARLAFHETLAELWRRGDRCLLVIHGRGHGSPGRPVLKDALPAWLVESPWDGRVRVVTTADSDRGGTGATLVLLHRTGRGS